MHNREDEILCDNSGKCEAPPDARGITNCIYCGKELHERNGEWRTWDVHMTKYPEPQGPGM